MSSQQAEHQVVSERRRKIGLVYERLENMLPVEGRDWSARFDFEPGGTDPRVRLKSHTPLGKMWIAYCATAINDTKQEPV